MPQKKTLTIVSFISLLAILLIMYILLCTNLILNHSVIGITYYDGSETTGYNLIVRYFKNENEAKKHYKDIEIKNYVLAAFDKSKSNNYRNTEDYFSSSLFPRVSSNAKLFSTPPYTSFQNYMNDENLMIYHISDGLKQSNLSSASDDTFDPLYGAGPFLQLIDEDYTKDELSYYTTWIIFGKAICGVFDLYELSIIEHDDFSALYWYNQVTELLNNYESPDQILLKRTNIDWIDIHANLKNDLANIKEAISKFNCGDEPSTYIKSTFLSFEARLISLTTKMYDPPEKITYTEKLPDAAEIRKTLRKNSQNNYILAKEEFTQKYPQHVFSDEYFFTDTEMKKISQMEATGKFLIVRESYSDGWVEVKFLTEEVGDDHIYIGEGDPFQ